MNLLLLEGKEADASRLAIPACPGRRARASDWD